MPCRAVDEVRGGVSPLIHAGSPSLGSTPKKAVRDVAGSSTAKQVAEAKSHPILSPRPAFANDPQGQN